MELYGRYIEITPLLVGQLTTILVSQGGQFTHEESYKMVEQALLSHLTPVVANGVICSARDLKRKNEIYGVFVEITVTMVSYIATIWVGASTLEKSYEMVEQALLSHLTSGWTTGVIFQ